MFVLVNYFRFYLYFNKFWQFYLSLKLHVSRLCLVTSRREQVGLRRPRWGFRTYDLIGSLGLRVGFRALALLHHRLNVIWVGRKCSSSEKVFVIFSKLRGHARLYHLSYFVEGVAQPFQLQHHEVVCHQVYGQAQGHDSFRVEGEAVKIWTDGVDEDGVGALHEQNEEEMPVGQGRAGESVVHREE